MKRILLITHLFLFPILIKAQYVPMLVKGNSWNYCIAFELGLDYHIDLINDTVINDTTYSILRYDNGVKFLLREDTVEQKVYERFSNTESIIYDFSANAGDSIHFYQGTILVVDSITNSLPSNEPFTISILNLTVHYLHDAFSPDDHIVWVQGIGSLGDFETSWWSWYSFDFNIAAYTILCHFDSTSTRDFKYHYWAAQSECSLASSLPELNENIVFYPNPSNGQMIVSNNVKAEGNGKFIIMDLMGREIEIRDLISGNNNINIEEQDLPNGVYLYRIVLNGKILVKNKLVIIR